MTARVALALLTVTLAACSGATPPRAPLDAAPLDAAVTGDQEAVDAGPTDDRPAVAFDAPPAVDAGPLRLRVLLVGNSYTFYHDLPALLARMGEAAARASRGPHLDTTAVTVGGASLRAHWDADDAPTRLRTMPWDAVVLQGQSVEPVLNFSEFRSYGLRFAALATERNVRTVWFATWPRRAGDALYAQPWSGGSPEVFGARLHTAYAQVAEAAMGTLAPVGQAWLAALEARPGAALYDPDGSHPSPAGTWLTACVLYRALTGTPAPAETESAAVGLDPAEVRALRGLAAGP